MLLSFPNWIIHIFSSLEWLAASLLLVRYGRLIGRRSVTILGLSMLPHWAGSLSVLAYHITTDTVPFLLDLSEIINLFGSISLLLATVSILKETKKAAPAGFMALMGAIMISGKPQSWLGEDVFDAILQLSSVVYISFLIVLLVIWRRNRNLFSGLTVGGFWFVLVFISVTVFCMYLATEVRGYPTLSHDDLLHGSAESLLSISNLMIALGVQKSIRNFQKRALRDGADGRIAGGLKAPPQPF